MQKIYQKIINLEKRTIQEFEKISFFQRNCYKQFKQYGNQKILGLIGLRGTGKSFYLIHQRQKTENSIYFSCDWLFLGGKSIFDIVEYLYTNYHITTFFIDEIHESIDWDGSLKNIYDTLPVRVIFSGSSMINILTTGYDLSRRVILQKFPIFSYQEFLSFNYSKEIGGYDLTTLLKNHIQIASDNILYHTDVLWQDYLTTGQFGYRFQANFIKSAYQESLNNSVKKSIYQDLTRFLDIGTENIKNIEKILFFISNSSPSELNINSLSQKVGISNKTMEIYIDFLDRLGWIFTMRKYGNLSDMIRKGIKIYMGNTNLIYYIGNNTVSDFRGTIRETFFVNNIYRILKDNNNIYYQSHTDFVLELDGKKYFFEIGGKSKKRADENVFVIKDDITIGQGNSIPLRLFGLL